MSDSQFTDAELRAYAGELLDSQRAAEVEAEIRTSPALLERMARLIRDSDEGTDSLGQMWRRGRWSCPPRSIWAAYVARRLGDGLSQYLRFHVDTIGCRICQANLQDLLGDETAAATEARVQKIFHSSAGSLGQADSSDSKTNR